MIDYTERVCNELNITRAHHPLDGGTHRSFAAKSKNYNDVLEEIRTMGSKVF